MKHRGVVESRSSENEVPSVSLKQSTTGTTNTSDTTSATLGARKRASTTANVSPEKVGPVECGDGDLIGRRFSLDQNRRILDSLSWENMYNGFLKIRWSDLNIFHLFLLTLTHPPALFGIYYAFTCAKWSTLIFSYIYFAGSALGVTVGMHRLWSHKSFQAHPVLECILTFWATSSFQYSVIHWCSDHRVHHKYSETEFDPHNAQRGLFYSHMGWLLYNRESKVSEKVEAQDVEDLLAKPWLRMQHQYYYPLVLICAIAVPVLITHNILGEDLAVAFTICMLRICCTLHETFCVNSIAHWEGDHPYDPTIWPVDNFFVSWLCFGEGWHNYHHTFPNDYRTSDREEGILKPVQNCSSFFIDACHSLGLVSNRITASSSLVEKFKAKHS